MNLTQFGHRMAQTTSRAVGNEVDYRKIIEKQAQIEVVVLDRANNEAIPVWQVGLDDEKNQITIIPARSKRVSRTTLAYWWALGGWVLGWLAHYVIVDTLLNR